MPNSWTLARRALFGLPAEVAHEMTIGALEHLPAAALGPIRGHFAVNDARLQTRHWGIDFANPVGLAAGLDKRGVAFNALAALGFGFVEIGTVTALAQPGNPRPRLFRLPLDSALLNRMGFNNPGAEAVAAHLAEANVATVLGINVGKSKVAPLDAAIPDYLRSIALLERFARYLVINVSSPNTPGLRDLQDAEPLRALLRAVAARTPVGTTRRAPVLLKLAPDLTEGQMEEAVGIAADEGVAGIIAVNTTVSREGLRTPPSDVAALGAGGISGRPLAVRAVKAVARIYQWTGGAIPIIGVGGIFSANDAWDHIRSGASLVQVYTGFVYGGPGIVREINRGIVRRMEQAGVTSIADAVGSGNR